MTEYDKRFSERSVSFSSETLYQKDAQKEQSGHLGWLLLLCVCFGNCSYLLLFWPHRNQTISSGWNTSSKRSAVRKPSFTQASRREMPS